jgi:hypothetical protein
MVIISHVIINENLPIYERDIGLNKVTVITHNIPKVRTLSIGTPEGTSFRIQRI